MVDMAQKKCLNLTRLSFIVSIDLYSCNMKLLTGLRMSYEFYQAIVT